MRKELESDPRHRLTEKYIEVAENTPSQEQKIEEIKAPPQKKINIQEKKSEKVAQQQQAALVEIPPVPLIIYRIDKDDVLEISLWRHPELLKEVIVRPDGMISYPLVGDIQASGLTPLELREKITQGLIEFAQNRSKLSSSEKTGLKNEYQIGLGDTLDISVWKIADLSREVIVRPDGMISYPLIGNIESAGKTLTQLGEELTKKLKIYVKEPQVSVMVRSFGWKNEIPEEVLLWDRPEVSVIIKKLGGKKIIVLGDVEKPGVYTLTGEVHLAEALALAGDCTKFAVKNNILVIRGNINNKPQVITANLIKLYKYADLSQNILLSAQDIVFVPRTLIGNINEFMETIAPIINTIFNGSTLQAMSKQ